MIPSGAAHAGALGPVWVEVGLGVAPRDWRFLAGPAPEPAGAAVPLIGRAGLAATLPEVRISAPEQETVSAGAAGQALRPVVAASVVVAPRLAAEAVEVAAAPGSAATLVPAVPTLGAEVAVMAAGSAVLAAPADWRLVAGMPARSSQPAPCSAPKAPPSTRRSGRSRQNWAGAANSLAGAAGNAGTAAAPGPSHGAAPIRPGQSIAAASSAATARPARLMVQRKAKSRSGGCGPITPLGWRGGQDARPCPQMCAR